jgi:hypothetical protein
MSIYDSDLEAYEEGKKILADNSTYVNFLNLIRDNLEFLSSYSFLQFGRDMVLKSYQLLFRRLLYWIQPLKHCIVPYYVANMEDLLM